MIAQIAPVDLARKRQTAPEDILLLDVREPYEREFAVIEPSLHIPMGQLSERVREVPRDREVVVYCHHGVRSNVVAAYLDTLGFPRVSNLAGGIDRWSVEVDPRIPRYLWVGEVLPRD